MIVLHNLLPPLPQPAQASAHMAMAIAHPHPGTAVLAHLDTAVHDQVVAAANQVAAVSVAAVLQAEISQTCA